MEYFAYYYINTRWTRIRVVVVVKCLKIFRNPKGIFRNIFVQWCYVRPSNMNVMSLASFEPRSYGVHTMRLKTPRVTRFDSYIIFIFYSYISYCFHRGSYHCPRTRFTIIGEIIDIIKLFMNLKLCRPMTWNQLFSRAVEKWGRSFKMDASESVFHRGIASIFFYYSK